jgi:diacylglycerol kinase (ATP)
MGTNKFSIKSRLQSFRYAVNGIAELLKNEHNSRIHLAAAIVAIILGIILKLTNIEWSLLIIVIGIVFLTELLNSAIEKLADKVDSEWDELIGKAKDFSAAAVLLSAVIAIIVGLMIFIPKIFL